MVHASLLAIKQPRGQSRNHYQHAHCRYGQSLMLFFQKRDFAELPVTVMLHPLIRYQKAVETEFLSLRSHTVQI